MKWTTENYPLVTPRGADAVLVLQEDGTVKSSLVSALAEAATPISLAASIAALRALPTSGLDSWAQAQVAGYYAPADGGGGVFYWDEDSTEPDNDGTIIEPDDGEGRWYRVVDDNVLYAKWFGVIGNGTSLDTVGMQAGLNALATTGGNLNLGGCTVRTAALNTPAGVSLIGNLINPDPRDGELLLDYTDTILLNGSAATVTLNETSQLNGLKIVPHGMTFPQAAAAVATWVGTAVTFAAGAHGAGFNNCAIVGFARASNMATSSFTEQTQISNVAIDCLAGIKIVSGTDRLTLNNVRCWPTASIGLSSPTDADLWRSGTAFDLDATFGIDAPNLTNCFSYGYAIGFHLDSVNGAVLINCVADYTVTNSGTIVGFSIEGDTAITSLIGCRAYRQVRGLVFNPNQSIHYLTISGGCSFEYSEDEHIYLLNGSGSITNSFFTNVTVSTPYGIRAHNCTGSSRFFVGGNNFNFCTNAYANTGTTPGNVIIPGQNSVTGNGTNLFLGGGIGTYASATTVAIPASENVFFVSGTTTIANFNTAFAYAGREITVIFLASLTVTNSSGLKLAGAGDFSATANDALTLVWGGSAWYEKCRSVN